MDLPRIALVWDDDSGFPRIITDDPTMEVFSVDERRPDDRVYVMGPGVENVSTREFDALIAGQVNRLGDKPIVEQAVRAVLDRQPNGKPSLSIVTPE